MSQDPIEVQRRRKGQPPSGRAEAPRRDFGQGGGQSPRPFSGGPGRGVQLGGCGSVVLLLVVIAFYLLSGGQLDLSGGSDSGSSQQEPPISSGQQDTYSQPVSNFTPPAPAANAGQTWTVMLYQDADDQVLEKDIFLDLNEAERVGSSDNVRIVSQIDRFRGAFSGDGNWTGTRRYYVTQDNDLNTINSQLVQEMGEVDMASGQSLVDFVQWAATNFPADHYVLILSDHGMGWPGGWSDPAPGGADESRSPLASRLGENIYLSELDQALGQARQAAGIDQFEIVGLDACLMAQMEVMAALQPHARYAVASEETEPSLGWAYTAFLGGLVQNPDMSGADLSKLIVQSYIDGDQRLVDPAARADFLQGGSPMGGLFGYTDPAQQVVDQLEQTSTISAIDLQAFPALTQSMDTLAFQLQNEDQSLVAEARSYAQSYTSIFGKEVPPSYIDLGHFSALLARNATDGRVQQAATGVVQALQQAVIAEKHGNGKRGSTGLSIYFPNSTLYRSPLAGPQSYNLIADRFVSTSLWDDFLAFHYTDRSFSEKAPELFTPQSGFSVRAPGQGTVSVSPIHASSSEAAPGQPVNLSVDISGQNIGYVYLFVGYYDQASDSIAVLDMDYLESPDTRELNGVYYPVWKPDGFSISFDWDPYIFAVDDGQTQAYALFTPQSYGSSADQAIYSVRGTYGFASTGESLPADLYFQNGNLIQVLGYTGSDAAGAPREITPQTGDTFTLQDKWIDNVSAGDAMQASTQQGQTLTFGATPLKWQTLYAAAGQYVVGFVVEDLDGNQYPVYTSITVK
ncbi:MAG: hypothetical protein HYZ25_07150 [Chloroflexi bacterium]|nr:hypothetical protein [Chloroflexota bacterium]